MELSGVIVLCLVSLVTASPHGYGTKSGATAKAEATASAFGGAPTIPLSVPSGTGFSGSFSKSSSSSYASSSASSSASSYSFSGTGANGIPGFGLAGAQQTPGGCLSGNCQNDNSALNQGANGKGGFNNYNQASASAIAGASSGFPSGINNPYGFSNPKPCSTGKCGSNSEFNHNTKGCKSGSCGQFESDSSENSNRESFQVAPIVPQDSNNFPIKNGQENSNPVTKYNKESVDYNKQTLSSSYSQLPSENKLNNPSINKPSLELTTPNEEPICTSHNCNFGSNNGKSPNSYNVPILAAHDANGVKPQPCTDGKCKNTNNNYSGKFDSNISENCANGNCDVEIKNTPTLTSPESSPHGQIGCTSENCNQHSNGPVGPLVPDSYAKCSSGNCDVGPLLPDYEKPFLPGKEKTFSPGNPNLSGNDKPFLPGTPITSGNDKLFAPENLKPVLLEAVKPVLPETTKPVLPGNENIPERPNLNYGYYSPSSGGNIKQSSTKHESQSLYAGNAGTDKSSNQGSSQGFLTNGPSEVYKGQFGGATRILSYSSGPPEQYSNKPVNKVNVPQSPNYSVGTQPVLFQTQLGGNIPTSISAPGSSSNYKPDYTGAYNDKHGSNHNVYGSNLTPTLDNKPYLDSKPFYANPPPVSVHPYKFESSQNENKQINVKVTDIKKPYNGGFGGPSGLLKPNDHSIPSNILPSQSNCPSGICGNSPITHGNLNPSYILPNQPNCPSGICGNAPNAPGNLNPSYIVPNQPNCPSGICGNAPNAPGNLNPSYIVPNQHNCPSGICDNAPVTHGNSNPTNTGTYQPNCPSGICGNIPVTHVHSNPSNIVPHQPDCPSGICGNAPGTPDNSNPTNIVPNQSNCPSGICGNAPDIHIAPVGAVAAANAVAYTGGFGGPPGFLKPYDSGKLDKTNQFEAYGKKYNNNNEGLSVTGGNNQGPITAPNGINNNAQASAVASSTAIAGGDNYGQNIKGCNSGCPSVNKGDNLHQGKDGVNNANASAKSIALANAQGNGSAVATASAHASAGAYVKGGWK